MRIALTESALDEFNVSCQLNLPFVTVLKKLIFIVEKILMSICGEFVVWSLITNNQCFGKKIKSFYFDNGIDRAGLLAETTVDTFGHIDIVFSRTSFIRFITLCIRIVDLPGVVWSWFRFNGDSSGWASSLA